MINFFVDVFDYTTVFFFSGNLEAWNKINDSGKNRERESN